jgi:hypothetical protein
MIERLFLKLFLISLLLMLPQRNGYRLISYFRIRKNVK